jgi:hypothetical protein
LISARHDPEDLALPLNGKKHHIQKKDFLEFGKNLNIPEKVVLNTLENMHTYFSFWEQKIQKSFLSHHLKDQLCELIKMRLQTLGKVIK